MLYCVYWLRLSDVVLGVRVQFESTHGRWTTLLYLREMLMARPQTIHTNLPVPVFYYITALQERLLCESC